MIGLAAIIITGVLSGVSWQGGTLDESLQRARAADKWVLVDMYTSWCGPCHEMDEKVYARPEVARAIEAGYLPLRRDGEQGEGEKLVERYHVVGYPTLLLLDGQGREVDRLMGFVASNELIAQLAQLRLGKGTLAELERKLAAVRGKPDEALRLDVGTRHAMRGDARAVEELGAVVAAYPDNAQKRAANALLTLGKYYYLRGQKDYLHAEATLRELAKRFPASEEMSQVGYNLGLALHGQKRDAEARTVLDGWIGAAPKDVSRHNSYAWLCFKNDFARERGIEVAKLGLAVDPKEHGLWDTLAELYFVTGHAEDARRAEERALAIKPNDVYYTAQLRRFQGAK